MSAMVMDGVSDKKKRLHIAKGKKKSWRKTDIKDVEEYLDDVRHQERTGGIISEKADESLFFVDKDVIKSKKKITPAERRRLRQKGQPLKCHSQLYRKGKITCPIKPNRVVKKVSDFQLERLLKGELSKKEEQVIKDRVQSNKVYKETKAKYFTDRIIDYDLWTVSKKKDEDEKEEEEEAADPYYLKYTNNIRVKTPRLYLKKRSQLPAIELPHAGASYNPVYEDHQDLLSIATEHETRYVKMQNKLTRALDAMFPTAAQAPTTASWIKEMSAGLREEEGGEKEEDTTELNDEDKDGTITKQPKAKTKKQHRKARERKIEDRTRKSKKLLKRREFDVFRVRSMVKEMRKFDAEVERKKVAKSKQKKEIEKTRTKRLGKTPFVKPELEVKLSDELPDSLRRVVPEGNLLEDRFTSLQRRNILEPRQMFKKRDQKKYKRKVYIKRTHKEDPL